MGRNTSKKLTQKNFQEKIDIYRQQKLYGKEIPLGEVPGLHARINKDLVSMRLRYKDEFNNKRIKTIGHYPHTSLSTAYTEARKFYGKVINGLTDQFPNKYSQTNSITLKHYIDEHYLAYLDKLKNGRSINLSIHKHFSEFLNLPLISLNARHITRWQAKMESNNYSAQTIISTYKSLRAVLNHAVKHEFIESNSIKNVTLERIKDNSQKSTVKRRPLSQGELDAFFLGVIKYGEMKIKQRKSSIYHGKKDLHDISNDYFPDPYMPIFYTLYYTGMRPGDVLNLKWEHVNLENLEISKILNKTAHHRNQHATKIPISAELKEILKKWHLQNGEPSSGICFQNPKTKKSYGKEAIYRPWKYIKKLGEISSDIQPYALRHNFISQLLMEGVEIFTICKIVGHTDPQMIMKHYGHLSPSVAQNAVSKLPKPSSSYSTV